MPSDEAEPDARAMHPFLRILWRIILTGHAAAAAGWMWMMPGGFPIGHARFWANRGLPVLVIAACVVGVWAGWRRRDALLRLVALGVPAAWLAATVAGRIIFPISARLVWLPPLGVAIVLGALAGWAWLGHCFPKWAGAAVICIGVMAGAVLPLTQRAGDPTTRPINAPMPELGDPERRGSAMEPIMLGERLLALRFNSTVCAQYDGLLVTVGPRLVFRSRSPDRCWTILARRRRGVMAIEMELPVARVHRKGDVLQLLHGDDPPALVQVTPGKRAGEAFIEAFTRLDAPVFSHLNTFCLITVQKHQELSLSFSPCPDQHIEVVESDYPVGRPGRLAYLGDDEVFRVVEASSGEKGPFRELAAGQMARNDPLAITLHESGQPICRIVLEDWARQASTALSPTAGWGLPQNAIEFSTNGAGLASIYITLAATSVGRGWDSVGHAAGVYRNRMRIEPVPPPQDGGDAKAQMPDAKGDGA